MDLGQLLDLTTITRTGSVTPFIRKGMQNPTIPKSPREKLYVIVLDGFCYCIGTTRLHLAKPYGSLG